MPDDRIEILPPQLSEKIAAGEVIERPGSVLKELIENSIDAGADRISVDVEDAGFALIRVADNGRGMTPDNMARSILRHATSKVRSLDDLQSIRTFGFRGEALASVTAVSRSEIVSCASEGGAGHLLALEGGVVSRSVCAPRARGTTVAVRDLFYNTPARKKFMKSRRAEHAFLARLFEQVATSQPAVHFTLTMEGRPALEAPSTVDTRSRIAQYAGPQLGRELLDCRAATALVQVRALLGPPQRASARPRYQDLYVNGRRVDNDAVSFAIRNAARAFLPPDARPVFFCFLEVDPSHVDVNIHPTKQRVKFDDERGVAAAVYHAVEQGLREALQPQPLTRVGGGEDLLSDGPSAQTLREDGARGGGDDAQLVLPFAGAAEGPGASDGTDPPERQAGAWDVIACYQIHGLFILAPTRNGILLIDQHAAHERMLFEQALDSLAAGQAASQHLLFPLVMELSAAEKPVVDASREHFRALGFDIEDFGGNSISVRAVPALMRDGQAREAIADMIAYLIDESSLHAFPSPLMRYAAAFACGAAIKAGQELSREEMSALLNGLFATRNPYTCPHGRPTVVRMSLEELKRRFLR